MSKLQQLTEAIHREIPEILELKWGCKILDLNSDEYKIVYIPNIQDSSKGYYSLYLFNEKENRAESRYIHVPGIKILGRDIQLADVLRVMRQRDIKLENDFKENYKGHPPVSYNTFYSFMMMLTKSEIDRGGFWDLSLPLHLQSQPTIDFLCDLIVKK